MIKQSQRDAKDIAAESGVDAGQISNLRSGRQLLGVAADKLIRLAHALRVPPADLILGGSFATLIVERRSLSKAPEDWTHLQITRKGTDWIVEWATAAQIKLPDGVASRSPTKAPRKKATT